MRVSLHWLKELVTAPADALTPDGLAERLSLAGFEVEAIEDLAAQAQGVVVGFVAQREPHPNADKLSVCQVEVGASAPLQIVCGAANVRAGIHVPVALVGSTLPTVNLTIKPAELRGVASSGMICSLTELGLGESDGIAVLEELLEVCPPVGSPIASALGLDDQVLELAITANRPDGLSMQGIAREVAALVAGTTQIPLAPCAIASSPLEVSQKDQTAMEGGGLFSVTALGGIQVQPSPSWLHQRLEKAGIRPINNVVDVTNLVMLETGQPLHAFDADRLAAATAGQANPKALGLRHASAQEPFTALDGELRLLESDALVVTYEDKPIALAGVMGGLAEAVTAETTTIWLEAAVFAPQAVRQSARSVGLRTEASSRFEKGLPRATTLAAADRAVELLQQLTQATVEARWVHQSPIEPPAPVILRRDALHNLLGPVVVKGELEDLSDAQIEQTLQALGCSLQTREEGWEVVVPPSRSMDLQREVDLIEEVARLVGYDSFSCHLPDPLEPGGLEPQQQAERRLRQAFCTAGLQECCTFSLVPAGEQRIPLANPLLADYGHLRSELHPELLAAARRNIQSGQPGFWGFEIGQVFLSQQSKESRQILVGVMAGERRNERWSSSGKPQPPSYYEARGHLGQALASLGLSSEDRVLNDHPLLHPGRAAQLVLEGKPCGWFGQLHPEQAEASDLPGATYVFELELSSLLTAATRKNRWQPSFSPFATVPFSERDLAVVLPASTTAAAVLQVIRKAGKPLLEQADLVDRYAGEQLADGLCSLAFRLRYRHPDRTLTDADIDTSHQGIQTALQQQLAAQFRA